jgi:glycosyltransferase involved in cell wall biosynthesis
VICLNVGGPATQVTEETGIKVDVTTPKQTLSDLGKAIVALQRSPDLRREMGARGRELIKKSYLWEHKGARLAALYEQLVQRRGSVGLAETDGQRQPACLSD